MRRTKIVGIGMLLGAIGLARGAVIELWNFDENSGTQFSGLSNSEGSASWSGDDVDVATDGSGNLVFSQGSEADPDNVFRNSTLASPDQASGLFEIEWLYTSATLEGGDATGASVGFGMRDSASNSDLFLVRLQRQNETLRLQTRVGTTNTNLQDFGTTSIFDLSVRVVADLDDDTFDVYWKLGSGSVMSSLDNGMSATGLEFDQVRLAASTEIADWGTTDSVAIDYLRVSQVPEISGLMIGGLVALGLFHRRR